MKLNASDIAHLAAEVSSRISAAIVQRARDARPGEVVLELRQPGRTEVLLLAAGDVWARLHLLVDRPPRRAEPTPFVQLLRKHLYGSRVTAVRPHQGDRVVTFDFGRPDDVTAHRLVAELTGRHGNLFLLDNEGRIQGSLRPNVSHRRALVVGQVYVEPAAPSTGLRARPRQLPAEGASRLVESVFDELRSSEALESRRTALARDLRREVKRLKRRLGKIAEDRRRAARATQWQRWGELLQSAYGRVDRGAAAVSVPDFYDPELPDVEIPLNPARSLSENITHYFKEAKRLKSAEAQIVAREQETAAHLEKLQTFVERVAAAPDVHDLEAIARRLARGGLLRRRGQPTPSGRSRNAVRPPYWEFRSRSERVILVGRNARLNDRLTLHVARGRDLWLHVDGAPGSHVIVRLERGEVVDGDTLVDAATLAAHYSKLSNESEVDVRYSPRKHVRKPKGAPPGQVTVAGAKTIRVAVDKQRLERLFASRSGIFT